MSAHMIFDNAPIGTIISWSDGTPRPPECHVKMLCDWKQNNSKGRLVSRRASDAGSPVVSIEYFTLRQVDPFGNPDAGWDRTFDTLSELCFRIRMCPPAGSARILRRVGNTVELAHLASSLTNAETWVRNLGFGDMVIEEISADQVAADVVEGRVAA